MEKEGTKKEECIYRTTSDKTDFCAVKLANTNSSTGCLCNFLDPVHCKIAISNYCARREGKECITLRDMGYGGQCRHVEDVHDCLIYEGAILRNLSSEDIVTESEGKGEKELDSKLQTSIDDLVKKIKK